MDRLIAYSDDRGNFILEQTIEAGKRPFAIFKNKDAFNYLKRLSKYEINDCRIVKEKDTGHISIDYGIFNLTLYDLNGLSEHKKKIQTIIDDVKLFKENEKIEQLKKDSKKKTPPKSKRNNKHVGSKIIGYILVGGMLIAAPITLEAMNENDKTLGVPEDPNPIVGVGNIENDSQFPDVIIEDDLTTMENDGNLIIQEEVDTYSGDVAIFEYEDNSNTDKAKRVRDTLGDVLTKYANRYGVDPEIMIGIATQEDGKIHDTINNGRPAVGPMQLEKSVWLNASETAYNYETGEYETIHINSNNIADLETNIRIACMYFQKCMNYMNNNIPAAIQCYNMGSGNMKTILSTYANNIGSTINAVLSNQEDTNWMDYRYVVSEYRGQGDGQYLEKVMQWLGPKETFSVQAGGVTTEVRIQQSEAKTY